MCPKPSTHSITMCVSIFNRVYLASQFWNHCIFITAGGLKEHWHEIWLISQDTSWPTLTLSLLKVTSVAHCFILRNLCSKGNNLSLAGSRRGTSASPIGYTCIHHTNALRSYMSISLIMYFTYQPQPFLT